MPGTSGGHCGPVECSFLYRLLLTDERTLIASRAAVKNALGRFGRIRDRDADFICINLFIIKWEETHDQRCGIPSSF
jgi:hypothetical protein